VGVNGTVATNTTSMDNRSWGSQLKTNFNMGVGATVSIPLFDNRQAKTALNKARLQREKSLLDLREQEKNLYNTIEGYWIEGMTNQSNFKAAREATKSQEASYELLSEQFRLGLKNIVELMTGKTNLVNAQQNELQSKYLTILDIYLLKLYQR
jgi:outer membrane protein